MRSLRSVIIASLLVGTALAPHTFSQVAPPAPSVGAAQPVDDAQKFPSQRGVVQQFTLTGRGDIDGLILEDGSEVKTPPGLSTQLAFSIKPGDHVTIHGVRVAGLPLMSAVSITNEASHRSIGDGDAPPPPAPVWGAAPPPPRPLPPSRQGSISEVSGRVRMALHGPQGEINGALLDSGTVLRLPPDQAAQFATLLQPRQSLVAQGFTLTNSLGSVLDVQSMGASRQRLQPVGPMRPSDPRARVGGRLPAAAPQPAPGTSPPAPPG